jgi:hypothetical protein
MLGVPAAELQRATCASLGMVFAEVLTIDEALGKMTRPGTAGAARTADRPAPAAAATR